jgi:hypothetical protein
MRDTLIFCELHYPELADSPPAPRQDATPRRWRRFLRGLLFAALLLVASLVGAGRWAMELFDR